MITALQDVSNVSGVNAARLRNRVDLTGDVRPLPATPSAIVELNGALRSPLTYDASGRLESQVALTNADTARAADVLTPDDIVRNPFYPAMAATLYLNAMTFRLQQSSAAELNSPANSVQMVGDVRAVSGMQSDNQGPADDFRNMMRTFA